MNQIINQSDHKKGDRILHKGRTQFAPTVNYFFQIKLDKRDDLA
jgi:hypothetical protein